MLPIQLITALFTATIVGATATFARSTSFTAVGWFMFLYLILYRTKVFLDDLVYYENVKRHAVGRGDPVVGLASWVLWIAVALHVTNELRYFGLTAATFGIGVVWILIARRNLKAVTGEIPEAVVSGTRAAHTRWLRFNVAPTIVAGAYFVLLASGIDIDWEFWIWWIGPVLLTLFLAWDVVTDYRYMFRLSA